MNAENFTEFLQSTAHLYHLPYVELESLTLEFPYSQNLQLLLFAKSWLEQHPNAEANLHKAALYSTDRRALYRFVQLLSAQLLENEPSFQINEDFLELKEITPLVPLPEPIAPSETPKRATAPLTFTERAPSENKKTILPKPKPATAPPKDRDALKRELQALFSSEPAQAEDASNEPQETIPSEEAISMPPTPSPGEETPSHVLKEQIEANLQSRLSALSPKKEPTVRYSDHSGAPPAQTPLPKSNFSTWRQTYSEEYLTQRLKDLQQALRLEDPIAGLAQNSVRENIHLASETLAELLIRQEQFQKAIAVYERLILIFPEKTAFFAGKIESLKNLLE
jgi:tetratricopeptide (TPR) repeat protein